MPNSRSSPTLRLIAVCTGLLVGSLGLAPFPSTAQSCEQAARDTTAAADSVAADSAAAVLPLATGYEQLRARYRSFQPVDSAAAGAQQGNGSGLALDGLVVDETQTRMGRTFYDVFYRNWEAPEGAVNFTVAVRERPSPGRGTVVSVRVNDETAFQVRLKPSTSFIERAAQAAVRYAARRLKRSASSNETGL